MVLPFFFSNTDISNKVQLSNGQNPCDMHLVSVKLRELGFSQCFCISQLIVLFFSLI